MRYMHGAQQGLGVAVTHSTTISSPFKTNDGALVSGAGPSLSIGFDLMLKRVLGPVFRIAKTVEVKEGESGIRYLKDKTWCTRG